MAAPNMKHTVFRPKRDPNRPVDEPIPVPSKPRRLRLLWACDGDEEQVDGVERMIATSEGSWRVPGEVSGRLGLG